MSNYDIWKDLIAEAFEDQGIIATKEQIQGVADWVDGTHENWSTYSGSEHIPNPLSAEIDNLKKEISRLRDERDKANEDFRKNVAMRRNVNPCDVTLEGNGHATYRP